MSNNELRVCSRHVPTTNIHCDVVWIHEVAVHEACLDKVVPVGEPASVLWAHHEGLEECFLDRPPRLIIIFVVLFGWTLLGIETRHVLLLLLFVCFIQLSDKEVYFILHLFYMTSKETPVLPRTFTPLFFSEILRFFNNWVSYMQHLLFCYIRCHIIFKG